MNNNPKFSTGKPDQPTGGQSFGDIMYEKSDFGQIKIVGKKKGVRREKVIHINCLRRWLWKMLEG